MSSLIRALIQTGVAGATAFGRALHKAIQNELQTGRTAPSGSGPSSSKDQKTAGDQTKSNYVHGMTLQEAIQILNIKPDLRPEEVQKNYKHLFEINDKTKGGSFYLQSKVYRARERVSTELQRRGIKLDDLVGPAFTPEQAEAAKATQPQSDDATNATNNEKKP